MTEQLIDLARRRPSMWVRPGVAWVLTVVLAYGGVLWMNVLHLAQGAHENNEPPLLLHWLRDGTLALPLIFVAVWAGLLLCRRILDRTGEPGAVAGTALTAALVAAVTSAVLGLSNPLHGLAFGHHHVSAELPWALHMGRDALAAFPVTLLLALAAVSAMARRQPWSAPARESWAIPSRMRARAMLRGAVALIVIGPSSVFAISTAQLAVAGAGPGQPCPNGATVRSYAIQAINVDIPLNRFGDHDPQGRMFVPADKVAAVRAQERSHKVSIGLRTDPIQPLVIRANEGDCVEITFTNNASGGDYGVHIDGLPFETGSSGDAIGNNAPSSVARGATTTYRYYVPDDGDLEGTHYIRPGPGYRTQVAHGLFGALEVEPAGSQWFKPDNTNPADPSSRITSGWEAVIKPGNGKSFREFVSIYHEVGDESFKIPNYSGNNIPFVDPHTSAYRPASRAINYRTEPFYNRLEKAEHEKSLAYNSYTFGDPATPWMRSYVGEPTKIRLLHGGGEMFHIYHLHGGGIRWRSNPKADSTFDYADTGINKNPEQESKSERLDSQSIGPGESYTLEIEGGAGGVNQTVGDLLEHCHIAEHYNSGMWRFWRVYNTLQPDLAPLRDDVERFYNHPPEAVSSAGLIGRTMKDGTTLSKDDLAAWTKPYLPPRGVPKTDQDGSVWNWRIDNSNPEQPVYLGEPEDRGPWADLNDGAHPGGLPGDTYVGDRPVIRFNPVDGRPAFPLLRPHVGQRAPQSPNGHTGTPFLGPTTNTQKSTPDGVPDPYAGHEDGLCPQNSPQRQFNMTQVELPIRVSRAAVGGTDPTGAVFVLNKDKAGVLNGTKPAVPLAIRSNIGDCDNITLVSEMTDTGAFGGFAKSNLHIHHVQFDIQGSDGASAGYVFDQSMRPYKLTDVQLTQDTAVGDTSIHVNNANKFQEGVWIAVGQGTDDIEIREITTIDGLTLNLGKPLEKKHFANDWAGTEFHTERWYPDVNLDNIFWHDHVDGIHGWGKGLVGQLIIEPKDSTYHDPQSGEEIESGELADIHTPNSVAPGIPGSFRELALWTIDDNPVTDSTLNLRAEPFTIRGSDRSQMFSSYRWGDPFTILPRAYPGDPFVIRTINVSGTGLDTLHVDGHRFRIENRFTDAAGKPLATLVDTLHYGVSEKFTAILDGGAGGRERRAGDYLFMNGLARRLRQGAWGILRVLPSETPTLKPLPGNAPPVNGPPLPVKTGKAPPAAANPGNPCPVPVNKTFAVSAVEEPVSVNAAARPAWVPTADAAAVLAGTLKPEPLALHVAEGDCVEVTVKNQRPSTKVSFHVSELDRTPASSGIDVGFNPENAIAAGATRKYRYYVDDARIGSAAITDFGDAERGQKAGLYGAVVVAPQGATFEDPATGAPKAVGNQVVVHLPDGSEYRDVTLQFQDDDARIGANEMPYPTAVEGRTEINYRSAGRRADTATTFSSANGDPATPRIRAYAGDPLHIHVVGAPGGEQGHNLSLGGFSWPVDPFISHSDEVHDLGFGPWETIDANVIGGAGGRNAAVGDFFYGDMRRPFVQAGMWGLIRVLDPADVKADLKPLE